MQYICVRNENGGIEHATMQHKRIQYMIEEWIHCQFMHKLIQEIMVIKLCIYFDSMLKNVLFAWGYWLHWSVLCFSTLETYACIIGDYFDSGLRGKGGGEKRGGYTFQQNILREMKMFCGYFKWVFWL